VWEAHFRNGVEARRGALKSGQVVMHPVTSQGEPRLTFSVSGRWALQGGPLCKGVTSSWAEQRLSWTKRTPYTTPARMKTLVRRRE